MRLTIVRSSILSGVILATVAVGCGGVAGTSAPATAGTPSATGTAPPQTTPSPGIGSSIAPCSLVTRGEAESALGSPALEPEAQGAVCHYDTEAKTKFFDLSARDGTAADFESMRSLCDGDSPPVAGLGDSSCSAANTVVVLRKGILISIIAGGYFNQDDLKSLAGLAVNRLP